MAQGDQAIKTVLTYWWTWLALGVVAGLEWAFIAQFQPPLVMLAAALGLGVVAIVAWPVLLVRSAAFARRQFPLPNTLKTDHQQKLAELETDFAELDFAQGSQQLQALKSKIDNLAEVLKRRLDAGEMTYGRYIGMADQVYLSALDNLHEVAVSLRSVSTIDTDYIEQRLGELGTVGDLSADQERESAALNSRTILRDQQDSRVARLIAQNESAMTVLDRTATALAETKTGRGQASMDSESAMAELEILAKRANKYATTR